MKSGIKDGLLDRLAESHSATERIIEGIDLELRVYSDTDWRTRDILGHIATWDREVAKSLSTFLLEVNKLFLIWREMKPISTNRWS